MSKLYCYGRVVRLLLAGALMGICQPAFSAGFQLLEQSAATLGTAYAGTAAVAEDASTGYFNPAGLTRLSHEQIAASAIWVEPRGKLTATRTVATFGGGTAGTGTTIPGGRGIIPTFNHAKPINDCWAFSFNVTSPFGLQTRYSDESFARYIATRSELRTIDLSPSLAYSFRNGLSLGAGVDAMYVMARLNARVGTGNIATDGIFENRASRWGYGYHAGALFEFNDCSRVGVHYRSRVRVNLKGDSLSSSSATAPITAQNVSAVLNLPDTAVLSLYHAFNNGWALLADVQWTHWQLFKEARLKFSDGSQLLFPENYKDAWRYALGTTYRWSDCLLLRFGLAYDRTPTRDANRSIDIPDSSRSWVALGAKYQFTNCLAFDFGYAHLFTKRVPINASAPTAIGRTQTSQQLQGTFKGHADLIGIQVVFDIL